MMIVEIISHEKRNDFEKISTVKSVVFLYQSLEIKEVICTHFRFHENLFSKGLTLWRIFHENFNFHFDNT